MSIATQNKNSPSKKSVPSVQSVEKNHKASAEDLVRDAAHLRAKIVRMSHTASCPHLGSALSCIDILTALYGSILNINPTDPDNPNRDRFVLSKGHAAPALYATLHHHGFFSDAVLDRFNTDGAELAEQPAPRCVPGIEAATGSLGHGLPIAVGMALAAKIGSPPPTHKPKYRTYACLSDGECNEGSTWEAAMAAPPLGLKSLTVIIDYNRWQATGRSDKTLGKQPLAAKWRAFGWATKEIDGHDMTDLLAALKPNNRRQKPLAIIAHTVKGKGVCFMEDDNNWHYRIPTAEEVTQAEAELLLEPDSRSLTPVIKPLSLTPPPPSTHSSPLPSSALSAPPC